MNIVPLSFSEETLLKYADLLRLCFASPAYVDPLTLRWLYMENPSGTALGFDVWEDQTLIAHYACLPCDLSFDGDAMRGVMVIHGAVDPRFRGQGLFRALATETLGLATDQGYGAAYQVTMPHPLTASGRPLGFQVVAPLMTRLGHGRLTLHRSLMCAQAAGFCRHWSAETLAWRLANPRNPVQRQCLDGGDLGLSAFAGRPGMVLYAELPGESASPSDLPGPEAGTGGSAHLFVGLLPADCGHPLFGLAPPQMIPSPLILSYRPLAGGPASLDPERVFFTFLDHTNL